MLKKLYQFMKSIKLIINTKSKSYPIYFGNNILGATGNLINSNFKQVKKNMYYNW